VLHEQREAPVRACAQPSIDRELLARSHEEALWSFLAAIACALRPSTDFPGGVLHNATQRPSLATCSTKVGAAAENGALPNDSTASGVMRVAVLAGAALGRERRRSSE